MTKASKKIVVVWLLTVLSMATSAMHQNQCSTLSCVHSSAAIIQRLNSHVNPCDDFYEYACGTFLEEQHTPDEKSTVDTIALMSEKLTEYLLTLLLKPSVESEPKLHKLAKMLFNSCLNQDEVEKRGKEPLINLIAAIGHWPMLAGNKWNETQFDWKQAILRFRKYVSKNDEDIFKTSKGTVNDIDTGSSKFAEETDQLARVEKSLKALIFDLVVSLGTDEDATELKAQIDELIEFEKQLSENQKKFAVHRRIYEAQAKNKTSGFKKSPQLAKYYKYILYMDTLSPFFLSSSSNVEGMIPIDFNIQYQKFIESTPKRTIANHVFWRIMQTTLTFLDKDLRSIVLTYEKDAFGKEDLEQRWILCAEVVKLVAPVAIGSLYINEYFTEGDKQSAESLVDNILQEYVATLNASTWMDESTKETAKIKTSLMKKYIGYHEKLRGEEATTFYDNIPGFSEEKYLEMAESLHVYSTDREFKRLHEKGKKEDWTKYSKPATVNAFYNSKDNSIQFPAAILQAPNFDKDRPASMNFGAIGSIIGHEITHAFDDQASKSETWSEESRRTYHGRVQCIINQYSNYRVKEIEEYFGLDEFHLNGNFTQKEDIADCGGVKLALRAYKNFERKEPEQSRIPIGLQDFTSEKLFWLSFAQFFCSVERPTRMKSKVELDVHSLDRFRVNGAASNMEEFSDAWGCPEGSAMNPPTKCAVW